MKNYSLPCLVSNTQHAARSLLRAPRSTLLAVLLCAPIATLAGVPQVISYQGRINLAGGAAPAKGTYIIQARIYNNATGGTVMWGASYPVSVDSLGSFNVSLGNGGGALSPTPAYATLAPALDGGPRYLGITVAATPAGWVNSPQEMSPRVQLLSSPYALRTAMADVANTFQGTPPSAYTPMPVQPQLPTNVSSVLGYSGTNLAASSLGWNTASNVVVANQTLVAASSLSMSSLSGRITTSGTNGLALGTNVNSITTGSFNFWQAPGGGCTSGSFTNTSDSLSMLFWNTPSVVDDAGTSTVTLKFVTGNSITLPLITTAGYSLAFSKYLGYTLLPVPAGAVISYSMAASQQMSGFIYCNLWQ